LGILISEDALEHWILQRVPPAVLATAIAKDCATECNSQNSPAKG